MSTKLTFSFEFYPPKDSESFSKLKITLKVLAQLNPSFMSLTYGALGSKISHFFPTLNHIQNELDIKAVAHFTAIRHTFAESESFVKQLTNINVSSILALRGDLSKDIHRTDFPYASDLVFFLRKKVPFFDIFVAGYPEGHPECENFDTDIKNLLYKLEQGANGVITQFFFNNQFFFTFLDKIKKQKCLSYPIIPGIMPLWHHKAIQKILTFVDISVPEKLKNLLKNHDDDMFLQNAFDATLEQCLQLKSHGVKHFHFYALNQHDMLSELCLKLLHS